MALGLIIDPNTQNPNSADVWALVTGDSVVNTIVASTNQIAAIAKDYDYLIDLNVQGQNAGTGWTYDSEQDQFTPPPSAQQDFVEAVQADFDAVADGILQLLSDYQGSGITQQQLNQAFVGCLNDTQSTFSANQLALMNAIYNYVLGGG